MRERERSSSHLLILQMATMARAGMDAKPGARN